MSHAINNWLRWLKRDKRSLYGEAWPAGHWLYLIATRGWDIKTACRAALETDGQLNTKEAPK